MPCSFGVIGYSALALHDAEVGDAELEADRRARVGAHDAVDLERRLLRQVVGEREDASGGRRSCTTTHWMVPVPSRTWRKWSLPLERRAASQPRSVTVCPSNPRIPSTVATGMSPA